MCLYISASVCKNCVHYGRLHPVATVETAPCTAPILIWTRFQRQKMNIRHALDSVENCESFSVAKEVDEDIYEEDDGLLR